MNQNRFIELESIESVLELKLTTEVNRWKSFALLEIGYINYLTLSRSPRGAIPPDFVLGCSLIFALKLRQ